MTHYERAGHIRCRSRLRIITWGIKELGLLIKKTVGVIIQGMSLKGNKFSCGWWRWTRPFRVGTDGPLRHPSLDVFRRPPCRQVAEEVSYAQHYSLHTPTPNCTNLAFWKIYIKTIILTKKLCQQSIYHDTTLWRKQHSTLERKKSREIIEFE